MPSDVRWDDVREWFDPEANGSLPDVCVRDTTIADLCGFLRDVGRALGKPVWMTPEAIPDQPLLAYRVEADQVVLLAAPRR